MTINSSSLHCYCTCVLIKVIKCKLPNYHSNQASSIFQHQYTHLNLFNNLGTFLANKVHLCGIAKDLIYDHILYIYLTIRYIFVIFLCMYHANKFVTVDFPNIAINICYWEHLPTPLQSPSFNKLDIKTQDFVKIAIQRAVISRILINPTDRIGCDLQTLRFKSFDLLNSLNDCPVHRTYLSRIHAPIPFRAHAN